MRLSSYTIIIIFIALMLIGSCLVPFLKVQMQPSAGLPSLNIRFSWPNIPAVTVEREVTSIIEGALSRMQNVEQISSVSYHGSGLISIGFNKSTDIEPMRFIVASQIRRIYPELPDGVSFPTVTLNRAAGRQTPLLTYSLLTPISGNDVSQHLEQRILPVLSNIKGVDRVSFYGIIPYEYQVIYYPGKIQHWNITENDLLAAIKNRFDRKQIGMAYFANYHDRNAHKVISYNISKSGLLKTNAYKYGKLPVSLESGTDKQTGWDLIPVGKVDDRIIYLSDLAEIRYEEAEPGRYYRINGKNTIGIRIFADSGENHIRLAARVRNEVEKMQQQMPGEWLMLLNHDETEFIKSDIRRLGLRMVFSLTILLLFVLVITKKKRYLLLIITTIAGNLLVAVIGYYYIGIEIHLYSLAGIAVSFGIIIDNSIVMIEHIRLHKNKKVFPAILAATLTTAGSLSVVFLLSPKQQALFQGFAAVMLVNLFISLVVAWFFVPALFARIRITEPVRKANGIWQYVLIKKMYFRCLKFVIRYKWLLLLMLVLGFGLPVHLMPSQINSDRKGAGFYNKTIGSRLYQNKIKSSVEKILGGSLRLFTQHVFSRAYIADNERIFINISGQMPDGANIHQINDKFKLMEAFLLQLPGIKQFETIILSPQNASAKVLIEESYDKGMITDYLQEKIISKALSIGGVEWRVEGAGRGFSNIKGINAIRHNTIILEGYNYDQLYRYANLLQQRATENPRVSNALITGMERGSSENRTEFFLSFNNQQLSVKGLLPAEIYRYLSGLTNTQYVTTIYHQNRPAGIKLIPHNYNYHTFYGFAHKPLQLRDMSYKSGDLLSIYMRASGNNIYKHNQQYRLYLNYTFLGPYILEQRVKDALIDDFNNSVPMGYRAYKQDFSWGNGVSKQFLLVLLVVVIIYFVCSILLESLLQPLAILSLIPVSFTGLFLTFYLFGLDFEQGGMAALILLSGLSVNSGLYILNDYNNLKKMHPERHSIFLYLKAFQYKIFPVLLTTTSTLIGLIPFVIGHREPFWHAFAAGTMGGIFFSLAGILILFPAFIKHSA